MKAGVEWIILCHHAELDKDGLYDLRGLFTDLAVAEFPMVITDLQFVLRAFGQPGTSIDLVAQVELDGKAVFQNPSAKIEFGEKGETVEALRFRRIPVAHPGTLSIMLMSEGTVLTHTSFIVSRL